MNLRIHRSWKWQRAVTGEPLRIGGPPAPLELVAIDTLQMQDAQGQWVPVHIEEEPKPPHPHLETHRKGGIGDIGNVVGFAEPGTMK